MEPAYFSTRYCVSSRQTSHRSVSTNVLAYRMREVMNVDKREKLWKCDVPILYFVAKQDRSVKRRSLTENEVNQSNDGSDGSRWSTSLVTTETRRVPGCYESIH